MSTTKKNTKPTTKMTLSKEHQEFIDTRVSEYVADNYNEMTYEDLLFEEHLGDRILSSDAICNVLKKHGWAIQPNYERQLLIATQEQYSLEFSGVFNAMNFNDGVSTREVYRWIEEEGIFKSFSSLQFTIKELPSHIELAAKEPDVLASRLRAVLL
jgi:hypothetical protein